MLSIGIGDGPETMHQALDLARQYRDRPETPRIWASAGIHPQEAAQADPDRAASSSESGDEFRKDSLATLDALLGEPEVIACGEIGLDYYHDDNPPREVQQRVFAAQMDIAAAHKLPILIHCRPGTAIRSADGLEANAWTDTLDQIEAQWSRTGLGGVLHCFTGKPEHARRALDLGFMISFAGNVTYPSASGLREIARVLPLDRMLVETDAPFLAPVPERGKRNEPAMITRTAAQLSALHGISPEELAERTTANFLRFFHVAEDQ
jgi:TatD DNase family protein